MKKCESWKGTKQKYGQNKEKCTNDTYPQLDLVHIEDILEPMTAVEDLSEDIPYVYLTLTPKCDWANLFLAATK